MLRIARRLTRPIRESLLARLVVIFFLCSGVIVALLAATAYLSLTSDLRTSVVRELTAFANICEASLTRWVDEQARNVEILSRMPGNAQGGRSRLPRGAFHARRLAGVAQRR